METCQFLILQAKYPIEFIKEKTARMKPPIGSIDELIFFSSRLFHTEKAFIVLFRVHFCQ